MKFMDPERIALWAEILTALERENPLSRAVRVALKAKRVGFSADITGMLAVGLWERDGVML